MLDQNDPDGRIRNRNQIQKIRELSAPTLFPWLFHVILDWSIISATLIAVYRLHFIPLYLLAALVIGNRQHALAVLGHDGVHYTLHPNRKLNDFLSNIFCFWPLLLTADGYRRLHFTHHNNTGTSRDPELLHKKSRAPQWDLPLNKRKVLLYVLKDLIGYSIPDFLIILTFSKPENRKLLIPLIAFHAIFIIISIFWGVWWVPLVWYGSLPTAFMMFFRLRLWIEHQGTFDTQRISLNPVQAAIIAPHKIWLHWEHHQFPTVPYHKLEEARVMLEGPAPVSLMGLIDNLSNSEFLASGATLDGVGGQ